MTTTINSNPPFQLADITGQVFGRLTVIAFAYTNKWSRAVWTCKCICGETCTATGTRLRKGEKVSCGCQKREASRQNLYKARPMRKCFQKEEVCLQQQQ